MAKHWMIFVKWTTILRWKRRMLDAATHGGDYPYQYSSDNKRFLQIGPRDVLWLVTTPRFGARGKPTLRGRARPPAVMARLRVSKLCCNRTNEDLRMTEQDKEPVCLGTQIPCCDEPGVLPEGVHPASGAWSIVAIGEKDPEDPKPLQVTYPVLYNFFGVLHALRFKIKGGETDLSKYLEFVEGGQYLSSAQREAKRSGKEVRNPGPYASLGQIFQTLRRLTPKAACAMNAAHERAVLGKRVFFSYSWADVESFAGDAGKTRAKWIREVNRGLDELGYSSWLDQHQILAEQDIGGLLEEVLSDAVRQSVVFVALLSESYGKTGSWTLNEWESAREQLANEKRKDLLVPIALDCGGDPGRLGLTRDDTLLLGRSPTPADVVQAIARGVGLRSARSER